MLKDRELGSEWDDDEIGNQPAIIDESKTLFLLYSSAGIVILILTALFFWYLIHPRLVDIGYNADIIAGAVFILFIIGVALNHLLVLLSASFEKNFMIFNLRNGLIESYLFAFAERLGRIFGISKDKIGNSFVKVNNSLVKARANEISKKRLLVLLPRCMQDGNCKQKVVEDTNNCKDCGNCDITEFKSMSGSYGFYVHVATGGTLARKKVKEYHPSSILAVACERELVSGMGDTGNIPVIGVPNERIEGPCKNTKADIEKVRRMVELLTDERIDALTEEKKSKIVPSLFQSCSEQKTVGRKSR